MAEEIELRHLRDKNGKKIAPFSPEAAIYDEKGMRLSDKLKGLNLNSIRDAQDEALSAIDEKENEAIGNFSSQRVIPDMLSQEVMALIEASGGGTINNMPDGEDLTSKDIAGGKSVMQLADRPYNPSAFSGKGYTILRKNVSTLSRGRNANILTQEMLSTSNTVYDIRYDFDLDGSEITVPDGCTLKFSGGSLTNGLVIFSQTIIEGYPQIYTKISGTLHGNIHIDWFDDGKLDYYDLFKQLSEVISNQQSITFRNKDYPISFPKNLSSCLFFSNKNGITIYGNNCNIIVSANEHPRYNVIDIQDCNGFYVTDVNIRGDRLSHNYTSDGGTHEFGYGMYIHTALEADTGEKRMNGMINNCNISQMTGDAIVLKNGFAGGRIDINRCQLHHCRRQGISVLDSDEVYIDGVDIHEIGSFDGIQGTAPSSGIDLEPASGTKAIKSCTVKNCNIYNTNGWGIVSSIPMSSPSNLYVLNSQICSLLLNQESSFKESIFEGCTFGEEKDNFQNQKLTNDVEFSVLSSTKISNCRFKNLHTKYIIIANVVNSSFEGLVDEGKVCEIWAKPGALSNNKLYNVALKYSKNTMNAPRLVNCYLDKVKFLIEDNKDMTPLISCTLNECYTDNTELDRVVNFYGCVLDRKINNSSKYINCTIINEVVE